MKSILPISRMVKFSIAGIGIFIIVGCLFMKEPRMIKHVPLTYESLELKVAGRKTAAHCIPCWTLDEVIILYPKELKVNESALVEVYIRSKGLENQKVKRHLSWNFENRLSHTITLTLYGASFTIKPQETIEMAKGTAIPLHFVWSISPTKEGTQQLVLDLKDLGISGYIEYFSKKASVFITNAEGKQNLSPALSDEIFTRPKLRIRVNNDLKIEASKDQISTETLEVEVLTKEGLLIDFFLPLKYGLYALGFILLYPAVSDLVKKILSKNTSKRRKRRVKRK
jgi:hypothetical protein